MNIFVLDRDIDKCARYHCDKHVVKMILESAQILCSACYLAGEKAPYAPTHLHHPCVKWAAQSRENWCWLKRLAKALNDEYQYRYQHLHAHKAYRAIRRLTPPNLPRLGLTPFVQAMPKQYQNPDDPVSAYRAFYAAEKSRFASWTRRRVPAWYRKLLEDK